MPNNPPPQCPTCNRLSRDWYAVTVQTPGAWVGTWQESRIMTGMRQSRADPEWRQKRSEYRRHLRVCEIHGERMAHFNAIAQKQTEALIAEIDRRLEEQ